MPTDLRSLLLQARAGAPAGQNQRRGARRLLDGAWTPIWRVFGERLPQLLLESLAALAKDEDPEVAKPGKQVLARDRRFAAEFEVALKAEFARAVDEFVGAKPSERTVTAAAGDAAAEHASIAAAPRSAAGLALVDFGEMEIGTVIEASAARARNATEELYASVHLRLANAVGEPEIRAGDSPVRPAIFFRALHAALMRIEAVDADTVLRLMPRFDAPMLKAIADAYRGVDSYLQTKGYGNEPTRITGWRPTVAGRATRQGGSTLGQSTQAGGWGGSAIAGAHAEQILQALYGKLQLLPIDAAAAARAASVQALGYGLPPGAALPPAPAMLRPVAGEMPQIAIPGTAPAAPMPQVATVALPGAPLVIGVDLLNAINEIQKLSAVALNAARQGAAAPDAAIDSAELRGRLIEKASAQVDKLTIEIVGLLFDRINADKHVPQPIKELLQRLQFPLIKVAVTDPALFVSADQPARRLIDRIASTSIGWTGAGEGNARYLAEVQKAVHAVLASTDEGIAVFERALAEFEAYLNDERTRDDDPVLRAKRALAEAEEREVLAINATIKIRSAFDGVQIESYLREFLLDTWVRVLVAIMVRDRDDKTELRRHLAIVPDLVWSVQPKLSQDERKRLVGTIPQVLALLRQGLLLIDWPKERMQEFFGKLMNSHAQAVKALELAHGNPGVAVEASTLRIRLDGIKLDDVLPESTAPVRVPDERVRSALVSAQADVRHLTAPSASVAVDPEADLGDAALDVTIAGWKRGDWFSLRVGDVAERVQLRWISPRKTLYLFVPAERRSGHSLSPESLRAFLRSGDLKPVESEPLFDRAVLDVVSELQRSAPACAVA
jgi:hypothetical protein